MTSHEGAGPQGASFVSAIEGERVAAAGESWDIPLDTGAVAGSPIPMPDPGNNPRVEWAARGFSALAAAAVAGFFLLWVFLTDPATVSGVLGGTFGQLDNLTVVRAGLIAGAGSILLMLALHPLMRVLVKSRVKPRTLDATQRALLDVIPDPVFFLDFEARLEDVNGTFAKAMGERPAALIGRRLYQFIGERERDRFYRALVSASKGERAHIRTAVTTGYGPRTFDFDIEAYHGHNTETPRLIGIARDITDQVSADRMLQTKYDALHSATVQTIESISGIVELRDPYLHGHHDRVAKVAGLICKQLRTPDNDREGIELAALVHDIGTIRVPFEILIKPDPLSDSESAIIEQHCRAGADILSRIDFPWPIADIVLQHHENFDGSGYPNKLKGTGIALGARVLAVADAYDAMISHRPYRAAVSRAEALQRLTSLSGRIYDPKVVAALSEVLKTANL